MKIKEVLKKMIFGYKSSSEEYIKYIKNKESIYKYTILI